MAMQVNPDGISAFVDHYPIRIGPIGKDHPAVKIWEQNFASVVQDTISSETHLRLAYIRSGLYLCTRRVPLVTSTMLFIWVAGPDLETWTTTFRCLEDEKRKHNFPVIIRILEFGYARTNFFYVAPKQSTDKWHLGQSCALYVGTANEQWTTGTIGGALLLGSKQLVGLTNAHVVGRGDVANPARGSKPQRMVTIPSNADHIRDLQEAHPETYYDWKCDFSQLDKYASINPSRENPRIILARVLTRLIRKQLIQKHIRRSTIEKWISFRKLLRELLDPLINGGDLPAGDPRWNTAFGAVSDMLPGWLGEKFSHTFRPQNDLKLLSEFLKGFVMHHTAWKMSSAADNFKQRYAGYVKYACEDTAIKLDNVSAYLDRALINFEGTNKGFSNSSRPLYNLVRRLHECAKEEPESEQVLPRGCAFANDPDFEVTEFANYVPNSYVFKVGAATGPSYGKTNGTFTLSVIEDHWVQEIDIFGLENAVEGKSTGFSACGDSGSWILDNQGRLVGLLWGGFRYRHDGFETDITVAIPIQQVLASIKHCTGYIARLPGNRN